MATTGHAAVLDQLQKCRQRESIRILPVVTQVSRLAKVPKGERCVEVDFVGDAPALGGLGLPAKAIAFGLLAGAEANVGVSDARRGYGRFLLLSDARRTKLTESYGIVNHISM
jgi:hypothetical protein